jgi:hypothetical protein
MLTWGLVTSAGSPVEVRFAGDTVDTPVELQAEGLTLATLDKVLLARAGSTDGWVVVCVLEAT